MEENEFKDLLKFSEDFKKTKEDEEKKLPYHINIIDELHINENGHSRVLTKLLRYKNEQKQYVILQSLLKHIEEKLKHIEEKTPQFKIVEPVITQEVKRIDLWIKDENYALIFENKVYNAADQDAQICRYIEKTREDGYKNEQIYVIYLSRDGKEPDPQSWGEYKESFKSRYVNLSFRNDILPWLKEIKINSKEKYLQSAILQYVDFLEGDNMFRTSEIYNDMNTKLGELIETHYSLQNESAEDKIAKLLKDKSNVSDVKEQMEMLTTKYYKQLYEKWCAEIKQEYNLETQLLSNDKWTIIRVKTRTYSVSISGGTYDNVDKCFYVGISPVPEEKLKNELGLEYKNNDNSGIHNRFYLNDYEDGYKKVYECFKKLVEKCKDL